MYRIGIDIGGTNTQIGLVDQVGQIPERTTIKTAHYEDAEVFCEAMARAVKDILDARGIRSGSLLGIGIGAPNGNYFHGSIEYAPNLRFKGIVPLVSMFRTHFPSTKVVLTNDANAAALGEHTFGVASDMRDFILITLGTGVGSGLFVDGKLVYGHDGFAGEIGHVILYPKGRTCGCGREGCLETYASAGGVVRTAQELLGATDQASSLRKSSIDDLSAKEIAQAALQNDPIALQVFDTTARHLALALANAVAHTRPEAIILFGGLLGAGEIFLKPLEQYFNDYLLNVYKRRVKLLSSGLPGADAAILGAASLIEAEEEDTSEKS